MANSKTKQKQTKNVEILWPKKTWRKIVGDSLCDGEKNKKNSGEYTGLTPVFPATHHTAQKELQV